MRRHLAAALGGMYIVALDNGEWRTYGPADGVASDTLRETVVTRNGELRFCFECPLTPPI